MIHEEKMKLGKFEKTKFIRPSFLGRPNYKSIGYANTLITGFKTTNPIQTLKQAGCDVVFHVSNKHTGTGSPKHQFQEAIAAMNPGDELVVTSLTQLGNKQMETIAKIYDIHEQGKFLRTVDGSINTRQIGEMTSLLIGLITEITQLGVEQSLQRKYESDHTQYKAAGTRGRPKISQPKATLVLRLRHEGNSYRSIKEQTGLALSTIRRIIVDEQAASL